MRSASSHTVYDREFYTSLDNILGLVKIGFMLGTLVFGAFMFLIGLGASQNGVEITRGMVLFYGILGYGAGFGALIAFFFFEHPNKWVRRAFFAILFAIPIVLEFGV